MNIIYGLYDPETNELKYVGRTNRPLRARLYEHIRESTRRPDINPKKSKWIVSLVNKQLSPLIIPILSACNDADTILFETKTIREKKQSGIVLLNATESGCGALPGKGHFMFGKHHGDNTRKKISKSVSVFYKTYGSPTLGMKRSSETKMRISNSKKGSVPWNRGKHFTEEQKQNISNSLRGLNTGAKNGMSKQIVRISDGKVYDSVVSAANDNNMHRTSIKNHCMGKGKKCNFRYVVQK